MPRRELRSYPTNYATDLTDEQWAAIAPFVATPSPNGGRPTEIDRRAIVNRHHQDLVIYYFCTI